MSSSRSGSVSIFPTLWSLSAFIGLVLTGSPGLSRPLNQPSSSRCSRPSRRPSEARPVGRVFLESRYEVRSGGGGDEGATLSRDAGAEEHWTKVLYERHPDLYLPILESRRDAGAVEADVVSKIIQTATEGRRGKVLDLACGIGRHSIPLAKEGHVVVGYDLSDLFVERARSWARSQGLGDSQVRFYQGDIREAAEQLISKREGAFDAIINLFSSLGAYGEAEDAKILKSLLGVAAPGCLLILETLNRDFLLRKFQSFSFQAISKDLRLMDFASFKPEDSVLEDEWRFYTELQDGTLRPELMLRVSGRVYTLHELKGLVKAAGWAYLGSYGNLLTRTPLSAESPSIVVVARNGALH